VSSIKLNGSPQPGASSPPPIIASSPQYSYIRCVSTLLSSASWHTSSTLPPMVVHASSCSYSPMGPCSSSSRQHSFTFKYVVGLGTLFIFTISPLLMQNTMVQVCDCAGVQGYRA